MKVYLVVAQDEDTAVVQAVLEQFSSPCCVCKWPLQSNEIPNNAYVVTSVTDSTLRDLITQAIPSEWIVHILPHKEAPHSQRGFCLSVTSNSSLIEFDNLEPKTVDILYCNEQPVLNKVVVGRGFNFQPGGHSTRTIDRLKTSLRQLRHLKQYQPQRFSLTTANEGKVDTAAVGIVAMSHVHKSNLAKQLLPENESNDGLFYALLVAPRSIAEMLFYVISEPFLKNVSQPGFIGIMRSSGLSIKSPESFDYRQDEQSRNSKEINFHVKEKALTLWLKEESPLNENNISHKETRKLSQIPQGEEAASSLAKKRLPLIRHAANDEFRELYQQLREAATVSSDFLTLMVLSTLLASFGLFGNSAPVIIGAMVLAPLMAPIVSLSMAFARQDEKLLVPSIKTLLIGLFLALGSAMVLSFLLPLDVVTSEIAARLRPTLLDLGVAVISGVAAAFAYARASAAKGLAGVAIAVALVPPLAVTGIGLGWLSWSVASGAFLLFVTNLAGIVFAAAVTFLLLGFSPFSRAKNGLIGALIAVVIVSIPLAISFSQLSLQTHVQSSLEGKVIDDITLRNVTVHSTKEPMELQIELVSSYHLKPVDIKELKYDIEKILGKSVILEAEIVIRY